MYLYYQHCKIFVLPGQLLLVAFCIIFSFFQFQNPSPKLIHINLFICYKLFVLFLKKSFNVKPPKIINWRYPRFLFDKGCALYPPFAMHTRPSIDFRKPSIYDIFKVIIPVIARPIRKNVRIEFSFFLVFDEYSSKMKWFDEYFFLDVPNKADSAEIASSFVW